MLNFKDHKYFLDNALSEIREAHGAKPHGILRVALPVLLSKNIIAPYIGPFLEKYPDIDMILSYRSGFIDLIEEGFDATVTIYQPDSKNYTVKLLNKFYIQPYATPEYLQKYGAVTTLDEAIKRSTVGYLSVDGTTTADFLATNIRTGEAIAGKIPHPRIYIDNLINAYELASSHKMMITAWDFLVEKELAEGKLVKILPEYQFREISCCLVFPSLMVTRTQKIFSDFIEECYSRIKPSINK